MPPLAILGTYANVAEIKRSTNRTATDRDDALLYHLDAASRTFEQDTHRRFFPLTATNFYRWPAMQPAATWALWLDDDLISLTSLTVADSGGATPVVIPPTDIYLEPQQYGPPYSRIEVSLATQSVFQSGNTWQQSIAVAGQWGWQAQTVAAGTVTSGLSTDPAVTTFTCSSLALVSAGDLLLIGSEALYVTSATANPITVVRAANGTTAAVHANAAPIVKYQAPASVKRAVVASALGSYFQEEAGYGRSIGAGDMSVEWTGKALANLWQKCVCEYQRVRTAVA